MQLSNDSLRYDAVSQALHWATVGLVIVLLLTGKLGDIEPDEPGSALFVWHSSLGVLVLLLAGARIIWGVFSRAPAPPADMTRLGRALARSMHVSLYALLLALPLSGWMAASAEGASVNFFWMASLPRWEFRTLPDTTTATATAAEDEKGGTQAPAQEKNEKKEKKEVFEEAHELLGNVLLILASLHTLAALKHQFIDRDELLRRMLPRRARRVAPQSGAGL